MKYLLVFLVVLLLVPLANGQELTPHGPIRIVGNSDFDADHGVVSGSGTAEDPYVIAGWDIDASDSQYGIFIRDTTAYFVIRNCRIRNATMVGIFLSSLSHGTIERVSVEGGDFGVLVDYSGEILIRNLTVMGSERSLQLGYSHNVIVENSTLEGKIVISSTREDDWVTLEFVNVSVGGGPFVYIYGAEGEINLGDFKEVYIRSCRDAHISGGFYDDIIGIFVSNATNTVIEDMEIHNSTSGIEITYSNGLRLNSLKFANVSASINVVNSVISVESITVEGQSKINFMYASATMKDVSAMNASIEMRYQRNSSLNNVEIRMMKFWYSENVTLRDSRFSNYDFYGLMIKESRDMVVDNCTFEDNMNDGMQIINSAGAYIVNSTFRRNENGISIMNSSGVEVYHNLFYRNRGYGIYIDGTSKGNVIHENSFMYNHYTSDHFNARFRQAADYGENLWNLTKGNYWTDWTGPDDDGDGIVDNPYPLKGGAMDYRPLTEPPWTPIPEILNPVVIVAVFALCLRMIGKKRNMKKS